MLAVGCAALGLVVAFGLALVVERIPEPQPLRIGDRLALALFTAAAFTAAAIRFGPTAELPICLFLFAALITVSAIDLRVHRLPNIVVAPTLAIGLVAMAVVSLVRGDWGPMGLALLGAAMFFVLLLVPHLISPRGMGFGDVKLAAVLGLAVGWVAPTVAGTISLVFAAAVLGLVLGVLLGVVFRAGWRGTFPLGPALAVAAVVVILWSESIVA